MVLEVSLAGPIYINTRADFGFLSKALPSSPDHYSLWEIPSGLLVNCNRDWTLNMTWGAQHEHYKEEATLLPFLLFFSWQAWSCGWNFFPHGSCSGDSSQTWWVLRSRMRWLRWVVLWTQLLRWGLPNSLTSWSWQLRSFWWTTAVASLWELFLEAQRVSSGRLGSRCQDGVKCVRELLGEVLVKNQGWGSRSGQGELQTMMKFWHLEGRKEEL